MSLDQMKAEIDSLRKELEIRTASRPSVIPSSVGNSTATKHLDGSNYNKLMFWMEHFPIDAGLWCSIKPKTGETVPLELDERALAEMNLSLIACAASETKKATKWKEAWDALAKTYEDSGIVRLGGLYSRRFQQMFIHAFKDNVVGGIILGGLPTVYEPLIFGIQGSNGLQLLNS
ncbi:hypothetical protein JTB14_013712 [Gonioctena quinquepunctata]|nr:hypothetical protein JTB14_013712 [Gonioctena quinquepunctata]